MDRYYEFSINVTLKKHNGSFGPKRERHTFSFCAQSADDARELACLNVPSRGWPHDEREVQILSCVSVEREVSDECRNGGCEDCHFLWCVCGHHSAVQFRAEHPGLRSRAEIDLDREERSAA